jgi:hypothetical protein
MKALQTGAGIGDVLQQLLGFLYLGLSFGGRADELGGLDDLDVGGHGLQPWMTRGYTKPPSGPSDQGPIAAPAPRTENRPEANPMKGIKKP